MKNILLIEDDALDAKATIRALKKSEETFNIKMATTLNEGVAFLKEHSFDVALVDLGLPDSLGSSTYQKILDVCPELPVIIFTQNDNRQLAREAIENGVQDYLIKGNLEGNLLNRSIEYAIERGKLILKINQAERNYRQLIEKSPDGIVITNKNGKILYTNQSTEKLFRESKKNLEGRFFEFPLVIEDSIEIELFHEGKSLLAEIRVVEIEWQGVPGYLAVIRDMSHKQQMHMLEERARVHEEYGHILSHEIRNPLAVIKGAIGIIDSSINQHSEFERKIYGMIKSSTDHLERVVENALMIARLENSDISKTRITSYLEPLLQELAHQMQPVTEQEGLSFLVDMTSERSAVLINPDLIREVVMNLLSNSLHYAKSKIWIKLVKKKLEEKDGFEVRVGNDGTPIPKEDQKNLFKKFSKLGNPQNHRSEKGTGLGLAICKMIVEEHEGVIGVESSNEEGTEFFFYIPISHDV